MANLVYLAVTAVVLSSVLLLYVLPPQIYVIYVFFPLCMAVLPVVCMQYAH